jgi:hypothetical protein
VNLDDPATTVALLKLKLWLASQLSQTRTAGEVDGHPVCSLPLVRLSAATSASLRPHDLTQGRRTSSLISALGMLEQHRSISGCCVMPRYHFHVVDGVEVFDSLKAVLPDNEAARTRAIELATNLGKANLADLIIKTIKVTNDEGEVLFRVPIRRST